MTTFTFKSYPVVAGVAISLLAMMSTSCSDDEPAAYPEDYIDGAIRFAAAADYSRSADITTNNLTTFNVYAFTGTPANPVTFMDNVTVTKSASNTWTYSPLQYWPAKQSVDFYAFSPASWVGDTSPLDPIPYNAVSGVEDIVYAVSPDQIGNAGVANAQVIFNFRHALSKLTVKMSSSNTELRVVVSNVAIANVLTKGNFIFPSESTAAAISENSVGHWTDQNTPQTYMLHWSQALSDQLTLTSTPTVISATGLGRGGVMFVLPQPLGTPGVTSDTNTYIAVQCSIFDAKSGERLWPNENTPPENLLHGSTTSDGLLKFNLATDRYTQWHPGVHYIYNLVINSNDDMGAISFGNPTVDTYIDIDQTYE